VRELEVVAGIVWDKTGGRVLITRRNPDDEEGGSWEFPGGSVEEGEGLEVALARELKEELGIAVEVLGRLATVKHAYPASRIVLHAFHCRHAGGEPAAIDCAEWRWVPLDDLPSYRLSPPDRRMIPLIRPLERDLEGQSEADHPPERIDLD